MTPYKILEQLKMLFESHLVEHNYKLRIAPKNQILNQEADSPVAEANQTRVPDVYIGNLPHVNFAAALPEAFWQAPYVLVGLETFTDDYENGSISILIQVCVYSDVNYTDSDIPDSQAYLDALNLLEFLRDKIQQNWGLAGCPLKKPVQVGMYSTRAMTWPYAFGYLTFDLELQAGAPTNHYLEG